MTHVYNIGVNDISKVAVQQCLMRHPICGYEFLKSSSLTHCTTMPLCACKAWKLSHWPV